MIEYSTDTVLKAMRLTGMANEYAHQLSDPRLVSSMSFDERFAAIVDAEWQKRESNKLAKCINAANFGGIGHECGCPSVSSCLIHNG